MNGHGRCSGAGTGSGARAAGSGRCAHNASSAGCQLYKRHNAAGVLRGHRDVLYVIGRRRRLSYSHATLLHSRSYLARPFARQCLAKWSSIATAGACPVAHRLCATGHLSYSQATLLHSAPGASLNEPPYQGNSDFQPGYAAYWPRLGRGFKGRAPFRPEFGKNFPKGISKAERRLTERDRSGA